VEKAENILLTESGNTDYWTKYSEKQSDHTESMSNLIFSKLTMNLPFTYYSTSYPKTKLHTPVMTEFEIIMPRF
jgi:hypothetical protein